MDSRLAWGKLRTTRPLNVNHPLHPLAQVPPHPVAAPRRLQLPHHQPPVVHPLHLLRSMCGIVRANLKSMKRSRGASFFRPIWNTPGQTSSAAYFLLVPFFAAQKARRRYKEPNKAHTHRSSSKIIYSDTSRRRVSTGVKNSRCTHFVQCCATQSCKPETQIVLNSSSCILNPDPTTRWRTEEITHASMRAHWFS